jgi:hypothetical protein
METERFDLLTRSMVTISRRSGLLAGIGAFLGARMGGFGLEDAEAKKRRRKRNKNKKKVRCAAGELRCGRKCCGQRYVCRKSDIKRKGKNRRKICASVCPANGGGCGEAACGNGDPGTNCATTVTTEGDDFCLDFAKANVVGCGAICRKSTDCGPGGVCVCMNNAPLCSCGEGVETSCFVRADVVCA